MEAKTKIRGRGHTLPFTKSLDDLKNIGDSIRFEKNGIDRYQVGRVLYIEGRRNNKKFSRTETENEFIVTLVAYRN